jgi:hypothetical protein
VAVRARLRGGTVTVTAASRDADPRTATGDDALALLGDLGVRMSAESWCTLVTDDPATLPTLTRLARSADRDGARGDVAAHLGWWADRADFPGSSAVVALVAAARARWVTGCVPDAERHAGTWRTWLDVPDDGCGGLLTLLDRVQEARPLPLLDTITRDDGWAWQRAQSEHADGWDWRKPDTISRAAMGLRTRCDTADLYAAALLDDPLFRRRAVHTGHVVQGTADVVPDARNRVTVTCARMDARLRARSAITGWPGAPGDRDRTRFSGTVADTGMVAGRLVLTLSGVTSNKPSGGEPVTLAPATPNPHTLTSGRHRYRQLYGTRTSWLTTGRTPAPNRRDVPLDVMVAAADD